MYPCISVELVELKSGIDRKQRVIFNFYLTFSSCLEIFVFEKLESLILFIHFLNLELVIRSRSLVPWGCSEEEEANTAQSQSSVQLGVP